MAILSLFFLCMWGAACYGFWKLLHLPSKPIEHFVCAMRRSTYPPHPEDWTVTHYIRMLRGLVWLLFVMSAFAFVVAFIGIIAGIGVLLTH
jgi:hypothetical protein